MSRPVLPDKYVTFGQYLRSYRIMLGFTQSDIAEASGVQKMAISLMENEKTVPNFRTALKILTFLTKKGAPMLDLKKLLQRQEMAEFAQDRETDNDEKTVPSNEYELSRE